MVGRTLCFSYDRWKQTWWIDSRSMGGNGVSGLEWIEEIPELFIIGKPDMTVVAFGSDVIDIFEVNDIISSKGWHLNALQRPNSIHICVTLQHVAAYEDFLNDLRESVRTVKENPGKVSGGLAPVYGAAGKMPDRGLVQEFLIEFMDSSC
ncbi:Sphingosine-1-phosphate lyase [Platanthera guangdongensis]|uniref:Sphingosine-1-phosphate lyase n=1 Tax=Platanthera guangdongensis TaxID=2320717 RepID=A0ABR2LD19_9ASPA